jgi:beta-barrel assembly-enhancing protease
MNTRATRLGLAVACALSASACSDTKLPSSLSELMPGSNSDAGMHQMGKLPPPIARSWPSVTEDLNNNRADGWGLVSMPEMERYLNGLLAKIKRTAGVPDYPGTVHITADTALAASSSAAGNIYVSQYWIQIAESEDEIFAVLAHEFGHVYLNHYAANDVKTAGETGAAIATLAWNYANKRASTAEWSGVDNIFVVQALGTRALFPAWQRSFEEAADRFGATISLKCGYSYSEGFRTFLARIGTYDKQAKEQQEKLKEMQTAAARDKAVKDATKHPLKSPVFNNSLTPFTSQMGTLDRLSDALATATSNTVDVKGSLGGATFDAQHALEDRIGAEAETVQETHGDAAQREADLRKQIEPLLGDEMPDAKVEPWKNARKQGATATILAHYALASNIQTLQAQKHYGEALAAANTMASGPTANDGLPLYLVSNLTSLSATGPQDTPIQILRRNQNAHERSWQIQVNLANRMASSRDRANALPFLQKQFDEFGRAPLTWSPMIAFYRQTGDTKTAKDLALKCTANYPDYRTPCLAASQTPAETKQADQGGMGHIHSVLNKLIGVNK